MTTTEFQTNINALQAELFSLAMSFVKDSNDAKDLVQDAMTIRLWTKSRQKKIGKTIAMYNV